MSHGLLSLPKELRLEVYEHALSDTHYRIPSSPPSFSIAWLRLCRQVYLEAAALVLPTVKFSFGTTEHLIFFLSSLSPEQIKQVRHVTVHGTPFGLYLDYPWFGSFMTHTFSSALECFPGLQLATLTVRDPFHDKFSLEEPWGDIATYHDIERLIAEGKGWRELRYVSCSTAILNWRPFQEWHSPRKPQPSTWDRAIKERDGAESGACVEVWLGSVLPVLPSPLEKSEDSSGSQNASPGDESPDAPPVPSDVQEVVDHSSPPGDTALDGDAPGHTSQPGSDQHSPEAPPDERQGEDADEEDEDGTSSIDSNGISWEDMDEDEPWILGSAISFGQLGQQGERQQVEESSTDTVSSSDWQGNITTWSIRDDTALKTERRPVIIVAKRGRDADVVADGQNLEAKLKSLLEKFGWDWKKMKRKHVLLSGHDDPCAML